MDGTSGSRAGLYKRISDDREGLELGVGRQDEDLRAAAQRAGDTVVDVYSDNDVSASTRSTKPRKEYARLLDDAAAGRITKIWAYSSSRLTRRPLELERQIRLAEQHGIQFAYIRSPSFDLGTADGRMIARMLAANDAAEAERTGERIARKQQQKAEAGEFHGGIRPFGFLADGVTHHDAEAREIATGIDAVLAGTSLRAQVADLTARGITSTLGKPFSLRTWKKVLLRPRNAGLAVYNGEIIGTAKWPPIVPEMKWRAAVVILSDPTRNTGGNNLVKWLGTGIYLCGVEDCGSPLRVSTASTGGHKVYRCRRAGDYKLRGHVIVDRAGLDDYVSDVVIARLSREDAIDLLAEADDAVDLDALNVEGVRLQQQLDELDDDLDARRIDRARWLRRNARLKEQLQAVEAAQVAAAGTNPLRAIIGAPDVRRRWEQELTLGQQRAIVDVLCTVAVAPAGRGGGSAFDEARVDIQPKEH
ncbi:MAG TPA: recombinase family protein [Pseudonocardiaceae bacterium]|nr:recombinase family protein [Pseudonocardiaceae bacterium]